MHSVDHPPHGSNIETKLQWIAIACMAIGLITSFYYHTHTLKAQRVESEMASYLHLNDRYHKLIFALLQNDSEVFKKNNDIGLQNNKYVLYELFELFATVKLLEGSFQELSQEIWPCWERRMQFLLSKPAMRHAWQSHRAYAEKIYKKDFAQYVETMIAQAPLE